MPKKSSFICKNCKTVYPKWSGKCDSCNSWNSIIENTSENESIPLNSKGSTRKKGTKLEMHSLTGGRENKKRFDTQIYEFNRVCGGGIVESQAILIGGDPGIGKSTLLLQVAAKMSENIKTFYISGEESIEQIRMRARRLNLEKTKVQLFDATNVSNIIETITDNENKADAVIIDSIQTMYLDGVLGAPGSVGQVRACASELIRTCKKNKIVLFLVGHVTKDGSIAGPRMLEHMVDTVLYFEGERTINYRILRSVKNRFGSTNEIGVFDMTQSGLKEVLDPSKLFINNRKNEVSGTSVFAAIEGTRPMLVEIQALISKSAFSTPKRSVVGWDTNRLSMVLAVLSSRANLDFSMYDIYLNVAGGIKITEPAADLACAAAIISAFYNKALKNNTLIFGEIGLSGEVRHVTQIENRLKEASKMGFKTAFLPKIQKEIDNNDLSMIQINVIYQLVQNIKGL